MEEQGSYLNRIKRQKFMEMETFRGNAIEEALEKERKLVANLKREIEFRDRQTVKFQQRYDETIAHLRDVVNGLTETININDKKLEETESLYQIAVSMLADEKAKVKEAHVSEIRKLQSQNLELDARLRWKSTAIQESKTQRYLERTRLEKEIVELKQKLQNQNASATSIEKLESQISVLKTELEEKLMALQSLESLNKTLINKELESRQELLEARNESTTLRTELKQKSETMQNLESLYNTLVLKDLRSTQQLQEARDENSTLRTKLEEKAEKLKSLESRSNTLVLKELESMLIQKKKELISAQELKEARNESITLRAELLEKSETLKYHQSLNDTLLKELEEKLQNLKATEVANNNLESQITILKTELEEKSEALKSLESHNNTMVLKELESKQELQEARNEFITLKADFKENSEYLESLNNTLMLKELMCRQELLAARSESITSLENLLSNRTTLVIKRLGGINHKAFQDACLQKFPNDDWGKKSAELCSLWEEYLRDAQWQPFKKVNINGELEEMVDEDGEILMKEIVDEDDEKLKELRQEYGEAVYNTVANALMEMNEHNRSGRFPVSEIWNTRVERIATMKEIIQYLVNKVKVKKNPKRRR